MAQLQNCWEFWNCGRELGGKNTLESGGCPAACETALNGQNGGINAGRVCWAITGTHCGGNVQGNAAQKVANCLECDFFCSIAIYKSQH